MPRSSREKPLAPISAPDAAAGAPPVLLHHRISRRPLLAGTWVTPGALGRQLDALAGAGRRALDGEEWLEAFRRSDDAGGGFLLTFDDGTEDLWNHRAVLSERGIRPVVFVPAALLGRVNRWEWALPTRRARHLDAGRLRSLADLGWEIGLHGATHRDLTRLGDDELAEELSGAAARLAADVGRPVRLVSYPFGRVDARVAAAARDAGMSAGFVVGRVPGGVPRELAVRRRPVYCIDSPGGVRVKLDDPEGRSLRGRWELWKERGAHGVGRWTAGRKRQAPRRA